MNALNARGVKLGSVLPVALDPIAAVLATAAAAGGDQGNDRRRRRLPAFVDADAPAVELVVAETRVVSIEFPGQDWAPVECPANSEGEGEVRRR